MRKLKLKQIILILLLMVLAVACMPQFFHSNSGQSTSHGSPGNGSLEKGYLMDYRLNNAKYFSITSYYLFGNGYVNSRLYHTLIEAYSICEQSCPGKQFKFMECSTDEGGKQLIHRTHQNGLSVDFMVPKKIGDQQYTLLDHLGLWHYFLEFDGDGKLSFNSKVEIDFETMAKHILALDDAARKNGLRIKKVLLQIDLKDDFYRSKSGQEVKARGIYFARYLTPRVDQFHDDHYHIDFTLQS